MYNQYFQFEEAPFSIAPNPRFLYMTARHQEALAHLLYGIDNGGGFVALTGEIGTGKTTLCRSLLESLPDHVEVALILNPKLNSRELLATICDELAIAYPERDNSLKGLIDRLNDYLLSSHAKGQRTVLIIDEAQNLNLEVLEQIRLLTNLETSEIKLLQIILVGQPELQQLLNDKKLRQLNQRISARYHLQALTFAETLKYITHRLMVSKGDPGLFTSAAIKQVYRRSKGFPRLINIICDRALLGAYASNKKTVSAGIVKKAAREVMSLETGSNKRKVVVLLLVAVIIIAAGYYWFALNSNKQPLASGKPQTTLATPATKTAKKTKQPKANKKQPAKQTAVAKKPSKPKPAATADFGKIVNTPGLTLDKAMMQLLRIWKKPTSENTIINCPYLATVGLQCLRGVNTWQQVSAFNRPVILELTMVNGETRHVVARKVSANKLYLQINGKSVAFKLNEVLTAWQGRFLLAWEPQPPGNAYLYPGSRSERNIWLRDTLQLADGKVSPQANRRFFDNALKRRLQAFQKTKALEPDGVVGPVTFIHLQNLSETYDFPKLN